MDNKKIKIFIKEVKIFDQLSSKEICLIAQKIKTKIYAKGEYLFKENTERNEIFIIHTGKVELLRTSSYGKEKNIAYFTEKDFLSEGVMIDFSPHSTSAKIEETTEVFILNRKDLDEFDDEIKVKLLSQIAKVIYRRMSSTVSNFSNLSDQYTSGETRKEKDLLGYRDVPKEVYYGIQTLRGLENFKISSTKLYDYPLLIDALAMVKKAAATANHKINPEKMPEKIANAISFACDKILDGRMHKDFVVDMIQGGAGTSTNMNANEVIANIALEYMKKQKGEYHFCHPNEHVNLAQSTNDVYPTALKIACFNANTVLIETLNHLIFSFRAKEKEFKDVIKMGRTQLQDAVPMTLGQTFGAYATTLEKEIQKLNTSAELLLKINMGATAIGTGITAELGYSEEVVEDLKNISGLNLELAYDLIEATQDTGAFITYSSTLKSLAIKLSKICNDLRLMSSGPRTGLNEINLPEMQPGSSIMPGKVNPVIPEVVNQIAFKVIGNDLTVSLSAEAGQLELNVMEPVIIQSLFESLEMLKNGMKTLKYRCIDGITANKEHCKKMVRNSIGLVTALLPYLGYAKCTEIAKEAKTTGRGVYDLVLEKGLMNKEQLTEALKPENMTQSKNC